LKKNKDEILYLNSIIVKLKSQTSTGSAVQTTVASTTQTSDRIKIEFSKDFGYARVDGFTLSNPPEYNLSLSQGSEPLKLTLVIAQQKDKSWKSIVSSSDSNVAVDIGITSVNPIMLDTKWYENLKLNFDMGFGDGALIGAGASANIGKFDVGPKIWGTTLDNGHVFYGASFSWAPFGR
jgi:hypothetical protein